MRPTIGSTTVPFASLHRVKGVLGRRGKRIHETLDVCIRTVAAALCPVHLYLPVPPVYQSQMLATNANIGSLFFGSIERLI